MARRILSAITAWGVDRVSIGWGSLFCRQVLSPLERWGFEVNIYNVPDLESFLKAALLLPTSLTADFSFLEWPGLPAEPAGPGASIALYNAAVLRVDHPGSGGLG